MPCSQRPQAAAKSDSRMVGPALVLSVLSALQSSTALAPIRSGKWHRVRPRMGTVDDSQAQEARAALLQTGLTVAAAFTFGGGVLALRGAEDGSAWFAAYILEESLSIDNLFVFSLIFDYFRTPAAAQPRVLRWGLIVAVALRATFILGGLALVERFQGVLLLFAGVLLLSAYSLLQEDEVNESVKVSIPACKIVDAPISRTADPRPTGICLKMLSSSSPNNSCRRQVRHIYEPLTPAFRPGCTLRDGAQCARASVRVDGWVDPAPREQTLTTGRNSSRATTEAARW